MKIDQYFISMYHFEETIAANSANLNRLREAAAAIGNTDHDRLQRITEAISDIETQSYTLIEHAAAFTKFEMSLAYDDVKLLRLRFSECLTLKEVAKVLKVNDSTVKRKLRAIIPKAENFIKSGARV